MISSVLLKKTSQAIFGRIQLPLRLAHSSLNKPPLGRGLRLELLDVEPVHLVKQHPVYLLRQGGPVRRYLDGDRIGRLVDIDGQSLGQDLDGTQYAVCLTLAAHIIQSQQRSGHGVAAVGVSRKTVQGLDGRRQHVARLHQAGVEVDRLPSRQVPYVDAELGRDAREALEVRTSDGGRELRFRRIACQQHANTHDQRGNCQRGDEHQLDVT